MKLLPIDAVTGGSILGQTIFDANGRILLVKGTVLDEKYLFRLAGLGIDSLYIEDEILSDVTIDEAISEKVKRKTLKSVKDILKTVRAGRQIHQETVFATVTGIINELLANRNVLACVTDICARSDRLFLHAVNVCTLSLIVGIAQKLPYSSLKRLAAGALLHDLGIILLPESLLRKGQNLDPAEQLHYQLHCQLGYDVLRKKYGFDQAVCLIAQQHHELLDGTGYPGRLAENKISPLAKIVAVCNQFNNLVNRQPKMVPSEALEQIMGLAGRHFDLGVVTHFAHSVVIYPNGILVRLNTGEEGYVVGQNAALPHRPVIRIITAAGTKEHDLATELNLTIAAVVR
ncbi:MAG: HD domain-containing protein [Heliobacteriaceae bacterium]|nr:HD domain-containing protein [Heliobacteriaceae bacterium]